MSDQMIDFLLSDDTWTDPHVDVLSKQPEMSYTQAYELQFAQMRERVRRGDRIVGYKASGTSHNAREMMPDPDMPLPAVGTLLSTNLAQDGAVYVVRPGVTHVETEIVVVLSADLAGPHVNEVDVARSIAAVCPAIEIAPWSPSTVSKQRSGQHAIATQKTEGLVVVGSPQPLEVLANLPLEGATLYVDGKVTRSGTATEVLGNPLTVVAAIARHLCEYDLQLEAGMLVLTGSITQPFHLPAGALHARASFTRLGSVGLRFSWNEKQA